MYQVARVLPDKNIDAVPVIWVTKIKGKDKCHWPLRDLKSKIKKRTPPPLKPSQFWIIVDIELMLNGKMFTTLEAAEKTVDKILKALQESRDGSISITDKSSNSESSSTTKSSSTIKSSSTNKISSLKKSSSIGKNSSIVESLSINENASVTKISSSEITVFKKKNAVIESLQQYKDYERFLSNEENMEIYANKWLKKPYNDEIAFINDMVLDTFKEGFFVNKMSFEEESGKISLADSNIKRCWIYIIGKKFGEKIISDKINEIFKSSRSRNDVKQISTGENQPPIQLLDNVLVPNNVIVMKNHFPINSDDKYDLVEILLLQNNNVTIAATNWNLICQNKVDLFVRQMMSLTFEDDYFLKYTTFKKGDKVKGEKNRLKKLLEGSNICKSWQVAAEMKFPLVKVSEDDIKRYYRTSKNTMNSN